MGGVLSSLIQTVGNASTQLYPGEYLVEEGAVARVDSLLNLPDVKALFPRRIDYRWAASPLSVAAQSYRPLYVLEDRPIITGSSLVDAKAEIDPLTSGPIVTFELDRKGGRDFGEGTGEQRRQLHGDRARRPGAGPAAGHPGADRPTRPDHPDGQDLPGGEGPGADPPGRRRCRCRSRSWRSGRSGRASAPTRSTRERWPALVGTLLVILIMVGIYRKSGMLAVAALALYILFTFGALAMLGSTLTLPGLAGLILSMGIAVDANVLIFERMREELALGKTVRLSIDEGFKHAMNAIVDSNVTTVMTALFLFQFGTGPVKGFAVTLTIGVLASMITAVFVTRTFYMIWLDKSPAMDTLSI